MGDDGAELIRWSDLEPAPWKNGGGTTREVTSGPGGSTDWDWRVSVADVEQDGPFSAYPGVDRVITLLEGPAMDLTFGASTTRLTLREPFAFRGEERVHCTVPGGRTRDLNLMTRRGRATGEAAVCESADAQRLEGAGHTLVVALEDGLEVGDRSNTWTLGRYDAVSATTPLTVGPGAFAVLRVTTGA